MNKVKALFPENVEKIIITKDDYDRLTGELTLENIELKKEIERLKKYENFIDSVIITPVDFNDEDGNYQLHNLEKQELYKRLFNLRHTLIHEQWDGKVFKDEKSKS